MFYTPATTGHHVKKTDNDPSALRSDTYDPAAGTGGFLASAMDQLGLINLPAYDVQASAGYGAAVAHEAIVSEIAFQARFLRDLGAKPEKCSIIWASGDSMHPTIPDGSILVVDHSQADVRNGCIYVVNVSGDLLVKRARRRLDAALELVSDNQIYPPETISPDRLEQLRVVGRVVYFCRVP